MNGNDRLSWLNPRDRLELAQCALDEAQQAASEAAWMQAPALVEIIGPRSIEECAKILTPLIHHHYDGFKSLSEEDRRQIYVGLRGMLKDAAPYLTCEQIEKLLSKPPSAFWSKIRPLEPDPEIEQLTEELHLRTSEYRKHLLATFQPSAAILTLAGQCTRWQYLAILQTVRTSESYRRSSIPPHMQAKVEQNSRRTLRAFAPELTVTQVEQLLSTPYATLDPEGIAR
jgi:hypothetical protein